MVRGCQERYSGEEKSGETHVMVREVRRDTCNGQGKLGETLGQGKSGETQWSGEVRRDACNGQGKSGETLVMVRGS